MSRITIAASMTHGFTSLQRGASAAVGSDNDDTLQQFMHRVLTLEVGVAMTITDSDDYALYAPRYMYMRNLSEDSSVVINSSAIFLRPGDVAVIPVSDGMHTFTALAQGGTGGRILEVFIIGNSPAPET